MVSSISLTTQRRAVLVVLLVAMAGLLAIQDPGDGPYGIDGSYYLNIARHVAEGDGLVTSVDLYHQGLPTLPARTNIYPLWPLLLGFIGRVAGVQRMATLLPRILVVIDLLLIYFVTLGLGKRLLGADRLGISSRLPWLDYGHLVVLLFGFNPTFFSIACYPYTEGLAFFFLFSTILLLDRAETLQPPRSTLLYFATGLAAGAAFLTRSQFLFAGLAIGFMIVAYIALDRVFMRAAAGFFAGWLVVVGPWILDLTTFVKPFTLNVLWSPYRATPELPGYEMMVRTSGALGSLLDAASGLLVAFNPFSSLSFVHTFGVTAELVLLAGVHFTILRIRSDRGLRPDREAFVPLTIAFIGLATSLSLVLSHSHFFLEWLFGFRHGLPFVLLVALALIELIGRSGRLIRAASILVVILSILTNSLEVVQVALVPPVPWPSAVEREAASWLARNDPRAIVLSTNAQSLSVASRANFRWTDCKESSDDVRRVLRLVRTDYILVYEAEAGCSSFRGFQNELKSVALFGTAPNRLQILRVSRTPR